MATGITDRYVPQTEAQQPTLMDDRARAAGGTVATAFDAGQLVRRAAAGDRTAWNCLVDKYSRLIWAMTRDFRLAESDAADVVQATWLRLLEHIDRIEHPDRLGSWLTTTARHECLRQVAAAKRVTPVQHDDVSLSRAVAQEPDVAERLLADERSEAVRKAISVLPSRSQRLLELLMADPPLPYAEISARLGVPIGSIGPTRGRCLERLRPLLKAVLAPARVVAHTALAKGHLGERRMLKSNGPRLLSPLLYHSVSPDRDDPYRITVHPQRFEAQMRLIYRLGMRGVSIRELLAAQAEGSWQTARLIGLTFDDGYDDFIDYALPVLLRYKFTATAFVLAGRLGGDNAWDPEGPRKPLMTAERLLLAAEAGMEIGSHGLLHVSLPSVSDQELENETKLSRSILQKATAQQVAGFCYPYGHVNDQAVHAVQAAGYDYACAIFRNHWPEPYALTRMAVEDPQRLTWLLKYGPPILVRSGPWIAARTRVAIFGWQRR